MARQVDGIALGAAGAGALLAYAGFTGISLLSAIQAIITGKSLSAVTPTQQITGGTVSGAQGGSSGAQGGSASANQAIAKLLAAPYGWSSGPEWDALVRLWNSESNWSNTIWNTSASCGNGAYAYGIVQACGHGERRQTARSAIGPYPAGNAGNPPEYGGTSNASAQISWGLAYIKANYGSPSRVPLGGY